VCGPYRQLWRDDLSDLFRYTPNLFLEVWASQIINLPEEATIRRFKAVASTVKGHALSTLKKLYDRVEQNTWEPKPAPVEAVQDTLTVRDDPFYSNIQVIRTLTKIEVVRCGVKRFPINSFPLLVDLDLSGNPLRLADALSFFAAGLKRLAMNQCFLQIDQILSRASSLEVLECDSPYRKHFDDQALQALLDASGQLRQLKVRYVPQQGEELGRFSYTLPDLQIHL
jgi:hypothetical protein